MRLAAVRLLERGTHQHDGLGRSRNPANNRVMQGLQPRRTIRVVQRNPGTHLRHIRRRVEIVSVHKTPMQVLRERLAYSGLPHPADAHQEDDHLRASAPLVYNSPSARCTRLIAIEPSPTADATRLMLPERTSPTANTPGRLVSSIAGGRLSGHPAACKTPGSEITAGKDETLFVERQAALQPVSTRRKRPS